MRVAADAGGHCGGEQAQACDESGHHDWTEAEKRGFSRGFADGGAFFAQFVDVADEDDGSFDADAEQREKAEAAGNTERRVREFKRDECADGFGKNDAERDRDRKFEIAVEREKNQENEQNR